MGHLTLELILWMLLAFLIGCILGCLFAKLFGKSGTGAAVAAGAAGAGAVAAGAASGAAAGTQGNTGIGNTANARLDDRYDNSGTVVHAPDRPAAAAPKPAPVAAPAPAKPAPAAAPAPAKPAPAKPAPVRAAAPAPAKKPAAAAKPKAKAKPKPAVATGKAERPKGLSAARGGKADNLQQVSGIGPKLERTLHSLGFFHFDQISGWTPDQVQWVDEHLRFKGRIEREEWIAQATLLANDDMAEFTKLYGTGGLRTRGGAKKSGSRTRRGGNKAKK